jgi:hypothetical protein
MHIADAVLAGGRIAPMSDALSAMVAARRMEKIEND